MSSKKFTLASLVFEEAMEWSIEQRKLHTVAGNLINHILKKRKLREAQEEAIIIYLWLKEKCDNKRLSDIIKSGILFGDGKFDVRYKYDISYINNNTKRFINRYMQDSDIRNYESIMGGAYVDNDYEDLLMQLLDEHEYTNYLFSLPMGTGKTFMIAAFIYIDMYMSQIYPNNRKYAQNFIVIAPPAKKTAILPSLKTIRLFNPSWILPENKAKELKRLLKIEVLDDVSKNDKLQIQNPNQAKINRTINGHSVGNVFIINAEKILPEFKMIADMDSASPMLKTKVERAENIKESLARLKNIGLYLDEAHHTYEKDNNVVKLRNQIDIINKYNNLLYCIGVSGTPYCSRKIIFKNNKIELEDIQDVVYYYPLTKGIGKFLKKPDIRKIASDRDYLITKACDDFFNEYDITYSNGTKSKMAFYCPNIEDLNTKILPLIYSWYDLHKRNKSEILVYYSDNKKYPIPSENKGHFLNLDNPTSKFRIIVLVAIGTEGWDCKSLTAVCLPRQKNEKNFVLQTTCRCLREVDNAQTESALIYLDDSNYDILDSELASNYHLSIKELMSEEREYKNYPIVKNMDSIGTLKYKNITFCTIETKLSILNIDEELKNITVKEFISKNPFEARIGHTKITETGIKESIHYIDIEDIECDYTFNDFLYDIELASWGAISCANLLAFKKELKRLYSEIKDNFTWFIYHPSESIYSFAKEIAMCFLYKHEYKSEKITEDMEIELLDWDMSNHPSITVEKSKSTLTYPEKIFDVIDGTEDAYNDDIILIKMLYKKMSIANKQKSFNYYPYRMESGYEHTFLKEILSRMDSMNLELYYNGVKDKENLQSFRIKTPYGLYTPDFLCVKRNKKGDISNVLIIEIKGKPYETEAKENFIKTIFLPENDNYDYIRIGDVKEDISELNLFMDKMNQFNS